jgi:hypothetical protein
MDINQNNPRTIAQRRFVDSLNQSAEAAAQRKQEQEASPAIEIDSAPAQLHTAPEQQQGQHVLASQDTAPAVQMKEEAAVNDARFGEQTTQTAQTETAQLEHGDHGDHVLGDKKEDDEAWLVADQMHGNMLLDGGHITGNIVKKAYLWGQYKDLAKRKRIDEAATKKEHLITKNMYGRGKIGAVMRNIDTASRIMHLIGSLSGAVALAANIAAFFAPAALPVGAIAGVIALAAHSAMAVLQGILIGRNLYRIRGLPEAEKAKILPTLYRDIAKLGFALLGVITGGVGLGGAMQGGGLMAQHALEGAEAGIHGAHMAGDVVGETIGTYGMGGAIAHQNEKEIAIGKAGGFDHHAKPHGGHKAEEHAQEDSSDGEIEAMKADHQESTSVVTDMSASSQEAISGADGLASDVKPLQDLSATVPQAQQAISTLDAGEGAVDSMPKMKEDELVAKSEKVDQVEDQLQLPKTKEADEEQADVETTQTAQKSSDETAQMQATAQREKKPGVIKRAVNWLKRKLTSFKTRVKRVLRAIQGKLTEVVLKMAGVTNLPVQMNEALSEQRTEAAQVMSEATAGRGALGEWKGHMDKMGKSK